MPHNEKEEEKKENALDVASSREFSDQIFKHLLDFLCVMVPLRAGIRDQTESAVNQWRSLKMSEVDSVISTFLTQRISWNECCEKERKLLRKRIDKMSIIALSFHHFFEENILLDNDCIDSDILEELSYLKRTRCELLECASCLKTLCDLPINESLLEKLKFNVATIIKYYLNCLRFTSMAEDYCWNAEKRKKDFIKSLKEKLWCHYQVCDKEVPGGDESWIAYFTRVFGTNFKYFSISGVIGNGLDAILKSDGMATKVVMTIGSLLAGREISHKTKAIKAFARFKKIVPEIDGKTKAESTMQEIAEAIGNRFRNSLYWLQEDSIQVLVEVFFANIILGVSESDIFLTKNEIIQMAFPKKAKICDYKLALINTDLRKGYWHIGGLLFDSPLQCGNELYVKDVAKDVKSRKKSGERSDKYPVQIVDLPLTGYSLASSDQKEIIHDVSKKFVGCFQKLKRNFQYLAQASAKVSNVIHTFDREVLNMMIRSSDIKILIKKKLQEKLNDPHSDIHTEHKFMELNLKLNDIALEVALEQILGRNLAEEKSAANWQEIARNKCTNQGSIETERLLAEKAGAKIRAEYWISEVMAKRFGYAKGFFIRIAVVPGIELVLGGGLLVSSIACAETAAFLGVGNALGGALAFAGDVMLKTAPPVAVVIAAGQTAQEVAKLFTKDKKIVKGTGCVGAALAGAGIGGYIAGIPGAVIGGLLVAPLIHIVSDISMDYYKFKSPEDVAAAAAEARKSEIEIQINKHVEKLTFYYFNHIMSTISTYCSELQERENQQLKQQLVQRQEEIARLISDNADDIEQAKVQAREEARLAHEASRKALEQQIERLSSELAKKEAERCDVAVAQNQEILPHAASPAHFFHSPSHSQVAIPVAERRIARQDFQRNSAAAARAGASS